MSSVFVRSAFPLILVAFMALSPVRAQHPEGVGTVHAAVGYFDGSGVYGDELGFSHANFSVELGGEAHLLRQAHYTGTLGATFRLAASESGLEGDDPSPLTSGFRPQHLAVYARLAAPSVAATVGFVADLGPDVLETLDFTNDADETLPFFNSDAQHAFLLGLSGETTIDALRLHAGLDGFFTLPSSSTSRLFDTTNGPGDTTTVITLEGQVDFGDQFIMRAGGGYALGAAEIGLDLAYAVTTAGESIVEVPVSSTFPDGEARAELDARYVLSVIPYVTFAPTNTSLAFTLAAEAPGGAYSEHVPYGITLTGDRQTKVRFPLSLRVRYDL